MKHKQFNKIVDNLTAMCKSLLTSKNEEYAREGDKLHNFKKASRFAEGQSQMGALKGFLLKHTVSIYDMMDDHIQGDTSPVTLWEEKIVDHINYLIILYAMVIEESNCFLGSPLGRKANPVNFTHDLNCSCDICTAQDGELHQTTENKGEHVRDLTDPYKQF
jgi:hypothetical protein